jgi:hypothetical protein
MLVLHGMIKFALFLLYGFSIESIGVHHWCQGVNAIGMRNGYVLEHGTPW